MGDCKPRAFSARGAWVTAGLGPKAAVERSRQLVGGHVRAFAIPLLLLTLAPRAVLTGRHWLLAALPPRLWTQVRRPRANAVPR